jgi:hypothetical protein
MRQLSDGKDEDEIEEELDEADAVMAVARLDAEEASVVCHSDRGILHAPRVDADHADRFWSTGFDTVVCGRDVGLTADVVDRTPGRISNTPAKDSLVFEIRPGVRSTARERAPAARTNQVTPDKSA